MSDPNEKTETNTTEEFETMVDALYRGDDEEADEEQKKEE